VIVEERLVTYINSLDSGNTPLLEEIEAEAKKNYVPVIRKEMQSLFKNHAGIKAAGANFGSGNCSRIFCTSDGRI